MRAILILLSMAFGLSGCTAPAPSACQLETLAELPLQLVNNVPVVAVEINGHQAALVLDTGSDATIIARHAAARLGVAQGTATRAVSGAGGKVQVNEARLDRLALGAYAAASVPVLLADAPLPPLDGVLGIATLVEFEVDLDVPQRRVTLYRARRCATAAPPWAPPFVRLPVRQQPGSGHLFVPVTLDSETLSGMLDSGASGTAMSVQSAEDIRIGRKALARLPVGRSQALNAQGVARRELRLRAMRIGDDVLPDPLVNVIDLPPFAGDVLVGEDYIGTRRLWMSFLLGRVWVAPSSSAPAR